MLSDLVTFEENIIKFCIKDLKNLLTNIKYINKKIIYGVRSNINVDFYTLHKEILANFSSR